MLNHVFSLKINTGTEGSIKLSYQRLPQYIHLISNTTAALPTARWKMSDYYIKPQVADQFSVGYFRNFKQNTIEFSAELYYKNTANFPDYRSGQNLLLKDNIETALLQGNGRSYGLELYAKKKTGRYTGWATYTYSRSVMLINSPYAEDRNFTGKWYPVNFDRPHNLNLIVNYYLNRLVNFTANFTYSTGRPISLASDRFFFDGKFIPHFPNRNLDRIPDYHRLDVSINIEDSPNRTKRIVSQWNFSVYNLYNRRNPYSVFLKLKIHLFLKV
ncbi:MAG: TonB-dependent receptor [Saprospiraceae bacterium]|nr:TonB-dependent receptor [Saprospiraceae bacterium]